MTAFGAHERTRRGRRDDWLTPRDLIERLGPFDLDPCAPTNPPWPTAAAMIAPPDDGLALPWWGRVWCNPPYAEVGRWVKRCAEYGSAVALIFARVDTAWWWRWVWGAATSVFFFKGRLRFQRPERPEDRHAGAGAASALVTWCPDEATRVRAALARPRPWVAYEVVVSRCHATEASA